VEARAERFYDLARHVAEARTSAQVGWDAYGYVLYDLAARGIHVSELAVQVLDAGMIERRYAASRGDSLRLLVADRQVWLANPLAFGAALTRCADGAAHVWVPREAVEDQAVPMTIQHVETY
jgi:hypothetical protein